MKSLIIIDDSRIFQKVVERVLAPYFNILGKGGSGLEAFNLYKSYKPDLVLMDITMPNCSGKEGLQKIIEFDPNAKVIMVSSLGDEATVEECLRLGAKAFVCKDKISHNDNENSILIQKSFEVLNMTTHEKAV